MHGSRRARLSRRGAARAGAFIAAVLLVAAPGAPAASRPAGSVGPAGPALPIPTAPLGGPVDDGWLQASPELAQFSDEAPPAGGPIWPGVLWDVRRTTLADGRGVDVQILHLDRDAEVDVRPTLAGGSVRGVATVAQQSGDPLEVGAVAAVNGGFWLAEPYGEPNGFFAVDGRLVSDAESQGVGPRGTVGFLADGRVVVDRIDSLEQLALADGATLVVDGVNRGHREYDQLFADGLHSLLAYTADYGGTVSLTQPRQPPPAPPPVDPGDPAPQPTAEPPPPADLALLRLAAPRWPATGAIEAQVVAVARDTEGVYTPGQGEILILATGDPARALDGVAVGDTVTVSTRISALDGSREDDWTGVRHGLAGGPMIVHGGAMTDPADWVSEGFEPHVHSDVRAPRTAVGVTAEGRLLLVVADGRRPGITHGFTIAELARYLLALGAVEAVSLDGGGSSQLVVDGILRNVPCCDQTTRAVATSLQIVHPPVFRGTSRVHGAGRVDTAAAAARRAFPDGASVAVLAVADRFPDALTGGPLAAALGGPLLLTARTGLSAATAEALGDLGVTDVVVLGGEAVISPQVLADLAAAGIRHERIAGGSRIDTAAAVARRIVDAGSPQQPDAEASARRVFVAAASTFADALVAAAPGGILGLPILLETPGGPHPANLSLLAEAAVEEVILVGGAARLPASLADALHGEGIEVTRLAGTDRYGTAAAVNGWLVEQAEDLTPALVVARGDDFPDALAGGPLAAARRARLMILPPGTLEASAASREFFDSLRGTLSDVEILGGLVAISSFQQWELEQLIAP